MAISDTIQSMYENVGEVYDTITNVTLPEHKNIENIPRTIRDSYLEIINNGINVIYDNWEKVTGEGTSLTLTPTEEAPMQIVYKGNTYQYSTSGKNKFNVDIQTQTIGNVTFTVNEDKTISLNGIASQEINLVIGHIDNLPIGDYIANGCPANGSSSTYRLQVTDYPVKQNFGFDTGTGVSFTSTGISYALRIIIKPNTNANGLTFKPMISTSGGEYEPYTNGPSHNPDYPQDIHVVSGDNTIKVEGKNMASDKWEDYTYTGNYAIYPITLEQGATYKLSATRIGELKPNYYNYGIVKDGTSYTSFVSLQTCVDYVTGGVNPTITINVDSTWVSPKLVCYVQGNPQSKFEELMADFNIQFEKATAKTDYEPYQNQSYSVNLGVENLFDKDNAKHYSTDGSGNTTTTNYFNSTDYIPCNANESFTISGIPKTQSDFNFKVVFFDSNKNYISRPIAQFGTIGTRSNFSTTAPSNAKYVMAQFQNNIEEAQFEKGSKANHYTPYGTTPIELCKIGTYQDKIDKSTGKNLFDGVMELGIYDGDTGQPVSNNSYMRCKDYIPVDEQTKYVITSVDLSVELAVYEYREDYSYNLTTNRVLQNGQVFTTNSGTKYIKFRPRVANTDLTSKFMVNKGNTALPYEPYGTSWYLKKEIGKVVLNGSESAWEDRPNYTYADRFVGNLLTETEKSTGPFGYSNYFVLESFSVNSYPYLYINGRQIGVNYTAKGTTTLAQFKTWLSTHNIELYYPLATPTYTEITGELLNQLEAIKMSYEGQTNLSQTNNDLPFILNPSALKKV